jgi:hypothetical protein
VKRSGGEGTKVFGHLASLPLFPRSQTWIPYVGYPFATLSVFRAKSSVRQQYQLATEA